PVFVGMRWMVDLAPEWCLGLWLLPLVGLYFARRHYERAGWAFWLVGGLLFLMPTSSVFPIADLAASRRMYLPVALLAAAVPAVRWPWVLVLVYAGLAGDWAYSIYREPKVLWRVTMERQPGNVAALLQYTKYVAPEEALVTLMSAPAVQDAGYQTELGRVYLELRKPAEALRAFGKALAIEPGVASHVYNRGVALAALGQREAAEMDFKRALEIDPAHKPARAALATR
ncbi:MAG: tetratricopeptide repeat protein, partial [Acidobacteria bacterium]|nr:tetratricopeptide repeat protein [Acidobacteriota bacterium]